MFKKHTLSITVLTLLLVTVPYLFAALMAGPDTTFGGFLMNPIDGASYIAKMRAGYAGDWRFTLPYTAHPGEGASVYLFYLFLGHAARLIHMPLVVLFHVARLFGVVLLLERLFCFLTVTFEKQPDLFRPAVWLAALGSGMGWLAIFFISQPSDTWLVEAYPFFSMYSNPHFPIGLALLLDGFLAIALPETRFRYPRLLADGLLLAVIFPFAEVVAVVIAAAWFVWMWFETRKILWKGLFCLGALGGPYLLYQYWAILTDPVLAGWNAQNITTSPAVWDFVFSFSPAFLLALPGLYALWQEKDAPMRRILIPWFVIGVVLAYLPFSVQRRFLLGYYIPCAALGVFGLAWLLRRARTGARKLSWWVLILAAPTNILVLAIGMIGAAGRAPVLYLSNDEMRALNWMAETMPSHGLVLAGPETSRWIPGWSGQRVVYGHPFETVNAEKTLQWVEEYYQDRAGPVDDVFDGERVDWIFYGPREALQYPGFNTAGLDVVYETGQVKIFSSVSEP